MRRLVFIACLLAAGPALAEYWIDTPSGYQRMGGASRIGPYDTREQAEQVNRQYFDGNARITGSDSSAGGGGGGGYYGGTGDPAVDAMMPLVQQGFNLIGQGLARALFGGQSGPVQPDPRQQAIAEAQRRYAEDMARKESEEAAHLREERHRKIERILKRLGTGFPGEAADTGDGVELKPGGNAFFGMGGSDSQPWNDPMVVDLRHLKRGAWLAQAADRASGEDAGVLMDEALRASRGERGFLPAYDEGRAVNEGGLLAFQKTNADYAKVHDFRAKAAQAEQTRLRAAELSAREAGAAKADYEAAKAAGAPPEVLEAKRQKAEGLFADALREREAWDKAREEADAAATEEALGWSRARRALQDASAGRQPGQDPFEKAPPSEVDAKAWREFQDRMTASRQESERERARILKEVDSLQVPPPAQKVHVHEGVVLGTFATPEEAQRLAREGRSPFTGKTYAEMNQSPFWNEPGREGAVVAAFGVPDSKAPGYIPKEADRVLEDHFRQGGRSLESPQAAQAVAQLQGKSFDRLAAHSNGAPITLGLIDRGVVEVKELHIVGGDRAVTDGRYYRKLIDEGKVKRVVVWINRNDPIPWGTSLIPGRADEGEMLGEHVARTAMGTKAGGDEGVRYVFMPGPGRTGTFESHYLETGYGPNIAKAYGVDWP